MEGQNKKPKKRRPSKSEEKEKLPFFPHDFKSIKENIKKEFLRTVKISNSFRVKGPRATTVIINSMNDNDHVCETINSNVSHYNNDIVVEAIVSNDTMTPCEIIENNNSNNNKSDTVQDAALSNIPKEVNKETNQKEVDVPITVDYIEGKEESPETDSNVNIDDNLSKVSQTCDSHSTSEIYERDEKDLATALPDLRLTVPNRNRKYSLDNTLLSRRQSWSQSEIDLHSVGKSPLERKSSFFRKRLDRFLKNTSEIFKKSSNSVNSDGIQRSSSMSFSLHSLNNLPTTCDSDGVAEHNTAPEEATRNFDNESLKTCSDNSLVGSQVSHLDSQASNVSSQASLVDTHLSQPTMYASQPLDEDLTDDAYANDLLLNSRAISFSSGLDNVQGTSRRKTKRANRVTWLASDSVAEYMRRIVQDRRYEEVLETSNDLPNISPSSSNASSTLKGRRLSYQRAVSGEDPVRFAEFKRRNKLSELNKGRYEMLTVLGEFTKSGIPPLRNYSELEIKPEARKLLNMIIKDERCLDFVLIQKKEPSEKDKSETSRHPKTGEKPSEKDESETSRHPKTGEKPSEKDESETKLSKKESVFNEKARQTVMKELIVTEALHIKHLRSIVEVFLATAHAIQGRGLLKELVIEKLYVNIPDVLNASLYFWDNGLTPMLLDAFENQHAFNSDLMYTGFITFRDTFQPYETFVIEQNKILKYLNLMSTEGDFVTYLTWCQANKVCSRLRLSDLIAKPMQRLTKYALIIRRIIDHTESEPLRRNLLAMEQCVNNYVLELNRTIRQIEEIEKIEYLMTTIDPMELDFRDDELEKIYRSQLTFNLKHPMLGCYRFHPRTLIYEGDLRLKDHLARDRIEVHVFLFTDFLLICKKVSSRSSNPFQYRVIRPKCMLTKLRHYSVYKSSKPGRDLPCLYFATVDELGMMTQCMCFSESKDPQSNLRIWEQKIRQAKLTYELGLWLHRNPHRDVFELDIDTENASSRHQQRVKVKDSEEAIIEKEARLCVSTMLHRKMKRHSTTEHDFSQVSMNTANSDSCEGSTAAVRNAPPTLRYPLQRNSTGGSSRMSSVQHSASAACHDDPIPGPSHFGSNKSFENMIPQEKIVDELMSITVNFGCESDTVTVISRQSPSINSQRYPEDDSNTLKVHDGSNDRQSMPDLSAREQQRMNTASPSTASERIYRWRNDQCNKLVAHQQYSNYLSPDHRGTSYPPPSPTRSSLQRGFALSFNNPPLTKMGHVNSQTQLSGDLLGPNQRTACTQTDDPIPTVSPKNSPELQYYIPEPSTSTDNLIPTVSPRNSPEFQYYVPEPSTSTGRKQSSKNKSKSSSSTSSHKEVE